MLGFPAHKLTMNGHLTVHGNISLNPSLVYMSARYGYNGLDESGENPTIARFDPVTLLNLNVVYSNVLGSGVTVSAGVFDLLDQKYSFIQPYAGGWKAPLPDRTREFIFRVSYSFGTGK